MKLLTYVCAAAISATLAAPVAAQSYGIATGNPGTLFHNIGTAVANTANNAGLRTTVQPATSTNQYIPYVGSGGIDFGVANLQEVSYAEQGAGWFEGMESPDLRIVGMIMPLRLGIFTRADDGIGSIAELEGRPVADGYTAQQTILPLIDGLLATADLTRDDIESVMVPSTSAGADAFMSGEADAFVFAFGAGKVREADASVGGLYALPMEPTEENLTAMRKYWPTAFFTQIEGGSTPGVPETDTYMAYPQVVFTHASADEQAVYEMTKALYEGKDTLTETFKPFAGFNPDDMHGDGGGVKFHPGALRFYEEKGL
ncbi:TAXI family TRAP transporter solute-binding subunit [Aquicoccus sp. SCR17]|nr:TAXI family TRAP transporter solute-binding subunit [Carideicomes alvinocaridis]